VLDDPAFTKGDGMLIGYLKSPDLLPNGLR
jgi:hypothetical protein